MRTPLKHAVVDCHAHLTPRSAFERAERELGKLAPHLSGTGATPVVELPQGRLGPLPVETVDFPSAVRLVRKMGVEAAIFSPPPFLFLYELPPDAGAVWARILNDSLAETVAGTPGMHGLASVALQDPQGAVGELKRAIGTLGFKGVEIASNIAGVELDNPALSPFYAAVQELDVPILVHPHSVAGADRMKEYYLRNLVGNPLDTTLGATRLVLGGVFDRFPKLKVCLSHAGGYFLAGLGRLEHGYRRRGDVRTGCSRSPASYLPNLYFDTIAHSRPWLEYVLAVAGDEHLLLGTDLPFDMGDLDPLASIQALGLGAGSHGRVTAGNAVQLFHLS